MEFTIPPVNDFKEKFMRNLEYFCGYAKFIILKLLDLHLNWLNDVVQGKKSI